MKENIPDDLQRVHAMTQHYHSAPDRGGEYCDERVWVSLRVCLSTIVSSELHIRSSPNFYACYLLPWLGSALTA